MSAPVADARRGNASGWRGGDARSQAHAIVLAGGDGTRLRTLTRRLVGDDRPKQFCRLLGQRTLLEETWCRVGRLLPRERTLTVVTGTHERFYRDLSAEGLIVQPANRGTAPAILYALLRVAATKPLDAVVILPADHWVSDDNAFMASVKAALDLTFARPDLVAVLGVGPSTAETAYGWIERGERLAGPGSCEIHRIHGFVEKPDTATAMALREAGALWNSFVIVGRVLRLLTIIRIALPALVELFTAVRGTFGTAGELARVARLYRCLPTIDFSRSVLAAEPASFAVLTVKGFEWIDLGDPARVLGLLRRRIASPPSQAPAFDTEREPSEEQGSWILSS